MKRIKVTKIRPAKVAKGLWTAEGLRDSVFQNLHQEGKQEDLPDHSQLLTPTHTKLNKKVINRYKITVS